MTINICFITTNRADYGLQKKIISNCTQKETLNCKLVVTGSHLSKEHGYTIDEIYADGLAIDLKIDMKIDQDSLVERANSLSILNKAIAKYLDSNHFDYIVLLGDRYELMQIALMAILSQTKIIHLFGGELTLGAIDDSIRHAISKMSHIHCVSTEEYRNRLIQMGEDPETIHNVGGVGVDAISSLKLLDKEELEKSIGIKMLEKSLLITFHPETTASVAAKESVLMLLNCLEELCNTTMIFTCPNFDPGSKELKNCFKKFCENNSNSHFFESLGQLRYLSALSIVDAVVGNSSSGILEAPSVCTPTINIGNRQAGRAQSKSVINCKLERKAILNALNKVLDNNNNIPLGHFKSPYGSGGASKKIADIIGNLTSDMKSIKYFQDIEAMNKNKMETIKEDKNTIKQN